MTKQAGPYIPGKEKKTPDFVTPNGEMKEHDWSQDAAKVASVSPPERSQEPLYTPYRGGPIPDIPKDWNSMPAPGDAKPSAKQPKESKKKAEVEKKPEKAVTVEAPKKPAAKAPSKEVATKKEKSNKKESKKKETKKEKASGKK